MHTSFKHTNLSVQYEFYFKTTYHSAREFSSSTFTDDKHSYNQDHENGRVYT